MNDCGCDHGQVLCEEHAKAWSESGRFTVTAIDTDAGTLKMDPEPELVLRAPIGETREMNFVRSTWLNELRKLPDGLPDQYWWPAHRQYLEDQLASGDNRILIAGATDDPHEILGYAVASEKVLEWIHVRKGLRNRGIAGALLRAMGFSRENPPWARWRTPWTRGKLKLLYRPGELRR